MTCSDFLNRAFVQLGAGLSVGLSGLAAGFAVGIVGDAGVRGSAQQPRIFVPELSVACTYTLLIGWHDSYPDFCRSFGSVWAYWWV